MADWKQIVIDKTLPLRDAATSIRKRIESDNKKRYDGLRVRGTRLEYQTEHIYANHSEHDKRLPVLFLFSNPHPHSVKNRLFLSEPRCRTFWQQLFASDFFNLPHSEQIDLERLNEQRMRDRLGRLMVEGKYKGDFLLYFHCYYPIPTRQLEDLRTLFRPTRELWDALEETAAAGLARLVKEKQIKHIVVFSVELFRTITRTKVKRSTKKDDVEKFLNSGDKGRYWGVNSSGVRIYLSLHTRAKDWKDHEGQRYFTKFLNLIFTRIRETI